jgi:hypothetical protein
MPGSTRTPNLRKLVVLAAAAVLYGCGGGGSGGSEGAATPAAPAYTGTGLQLIVATDSGATLSIWPGEKITRKVLLSKALTSIRTELGIESANGAIQLTPAGEGGTLTVDGTVLAAGSKHAVTVIAKNLDNGTSERLVLEISVLTPAVVASGTLGSAGGAVSSAGGAIGLQINAGQLTAALGVTIRSAPLASGGSRIRVQFSRSVAAETAKVTLISNLAATASSLGAASSARSRATASSAVRLASGPYALSTTLQNFPGYFLESTGFRLASVTNFLGTLSKASCGEGQTTNGLCLDLDPVASRLTSSRPAAELAQFRDAQTSTGPTLVPVLFVHGYKNQLGADLGGGEGTWNDFPQLIGSLSGSDKLYLPFEFQWRTNASFSVVADELAQAIVRIRNLTGKPPRVVAHSFGGVLMRTLLAGLGENTKSFDPWYVNGVLTLGTPHSGIFAQATTVDGVSFPVGRDTGLIAQCNQISCHQAGAGEGLEWGASPDDVKAITAAGDAAGQFMAKVVQAGLPSGMLFVVGIGLKREDGSNSTYDSGDGLISFEGQRFDPSDGLGGSLADCNFGGAGIVKEVVLKDGTQDAALRPGSSVVGDVRGYSHTGAFTAIEVLPFEPAVGIEYGEPHVTCASAANCDHAGFNLMRAILLTPSQYCDVRINVPVPAAPTLLGSNVTLTGDYPDLGTHFTVPNTQTVREGPEYLTGSLQLLNFTSIISSVVDIRASEISITYTQTATAAFGSFNGLVFDFEPSTPRIVQARLNPLSSFTANQVTVTFSDHRVAFSAPGLFIPSGARILIDLTLETP